MLPDKFNLTQQEIKYLYTDSMIALIHQLSKLELVKTTYTQTKAIVEKMSVSGVTPDEVQVIANLSNAYKYLLEETSDFSLEIAERINGYVAYNEALEWGKLRSGEVGIGGVSYKPTIPVRVNVEAEIYNILQLTESDTYRAIKYMYYAMRKQLFWDGNKRTAILSANYMLLQKGKGILIIHEENLEHWNKLLSEFYETNNDEPIIQWTYENCIL